MYYCVILSSSLQTWFSYDYESANPSYFIHWIFHPLRSSKFEAFIITVQWKRWQKQKQSSVQKKVCKSCKSCMVLISDRCPSFKLLLNPFFKGSTLIQSSFFLTSNEAPGRKITLQSKLQNFIKGKVKCDAPFPLCKLQSGISLFIFNLMWLQ